MPPGTTVRKTNVVSTGGGRLEVKRGILYGLPIHLYGEQKWVNDSLLEIKFLVLKIQSGASYLSQNFVTFCHVSCEGLLGK